MPVNYYFDWIFSKSYHYTRTTRSARPLLPFPLSLAPVMDAKMDAKSFTPYFIRSKKLQKSRLFLRTSGFFGTPDAIRTHGLWSRSVYCSFYFAQNHAIIAHFIEISKRDTNF